jgi:NADH dehydrogenase FAD-containing subunit
MKSYLVNKLFYSTNSDLEKNNVIKKQKIILLGDGFFARGFLRYIDNNKYIITQIYRDEFINPQDIMYSLQHNTNYKPLHLRDYFTKPADIKIKTNITELDISISNKVKINDTFYNYNYLVIGLGANKSLYEWKNEINKINDINSNISIIGMGPTGIELSCILSETKKINLFDMFSKETIFKNKENLLKILENKNIKMMFETKYNSNYSKDFIFCGGTKPNNLTINYKTNNYLQINENIYMGGDSNNINYNKTAQVAYQQGVYVAKRLNGEIDTEFNYNHNGTSLNIGNKKVLIENHNIIPDGIYPDIIIKIYSLFCI